MDLSGISNSYFNQISSNVTNANDSSKKVKNLIDGDLNNADDEKLMDACKEFESYMLEQVMKRMDSMTKALGDDEQEDSNSTMLSYFKGNVMQEMAGDVADKGSIGIANELFQAMKRQQNAIRPETLTNES